MSARSNSAPVERIKPGPVVGWRKIDGYLYLGPGGRMINALGLIIDDGPEKTDTNAVVNKVEPDNYEDKI